ncbi:MAG: hypothetical protein HC905_06840, partial [Bacteroidales bacterium]|nr:hypothetical protein [Bacteroidales bacterium]
DYFYFAVKVADNSPHPGTYRFENRNNDEFFYPDTAYRPDFSLSFVKKDGHRNTADSENQRFKILGDPDDSCISGNPMRITLALASNWKMLKIKPPK